MSATRNYTLEKDNITMADPNTNNVEQDETENVGGSSVQEDENAGDNILMADSNTNNVEQDENENIGDSNAQEDENAGVSESNIQQDENLVAAEDKDVLPDSEDFELAEATVLPEDDNGILSPDTAALLSDKEEFEIVFPADETIDQSTEITSDILKETEDALLQGDEIDAMGSTQLIKDEDIQKIVEEISREDDASKEPVDDEEVEVDMTDEEGKISEISTEEKSKDEEKEAADKAESHLDVQSTVIEAAAEEAAAEETAAEEVTAKEVAAEEATAEEAAAEEVTAKEVAGEEATAEEAAAEEVAAEKPAAEEAATEEAEPRSFLHSSVKVKILLLPQKEMVTITCTLGETIMQIKERFWRRMQIEPLVLKISFKGEAQQGTTQLIDLGATPNGTIEFELESRDPEHFPLKPFHQVCYTPDILSIKVADKKGQRKLVPVEVLQPTREKPFLGGFRHKINHVEYHNASSQTKPLPLRWPDRAMFTRDTQTKQVSNQKIQTPQDTSTQMTKIGCYVSVAENKLHTPGKYITAKEKEDVRLEKVIVLQKYFRRYLASKYVNQIRLQKEARLQFERDEALKRKQEKENRIKAEFLRRQYPRSRKDFHTLYDALEKWRLQEIAKIDATLTGAERKVALYMLLNQEMEHLAAIGRHQAIADEIIAEKHIQSFLNKSAAPRSIISTYDNHKTLIDTPYTIRARELQEIYNNLVISNFTLDERLDILLTLKYTVREHDCKLCYEVIRLVDREADLLMRGVSNNSLAGLRKRIATLFLQYIKTPVFNPEAARYSMLPPLTKNQKVYYCASCNKFYSSNQFPLNVNAQIPGPCKMCKSKDNEGRLRADYNIYRYMLKSLRSREERYKDNSTIAFLIQDSDIYYLVEKIWNSESIISNCKDLYELIWVRWNKDEVWSPWNCLLVTLEEAECHSKLDDFKTAYGEVFVNKVHQKHLLAKSHFSRLPWLVKQIDQPARLRRSFSHKGSGKYLSKKTSCNIFPSS